MARRGKRPVEKGSWGTPGMRGSLKYRAGASFSLALGGEIQIVAEPASDVNHDVCYPISNLVQIQCKYRGRTWLVGDDTARHESCQQAVTREHYTSFDELRGTNL